MEDWLHRKYGDVDLSFARARMGGSPNANFNSKFLYDDKVANTVIGGEKCVLYDEPRYRNRTEICLCSSWPLDYDFLSEKDSYICGMSVPPVMMAQVASRIYDQWLTKINETKN